MAVAVVKDGEVVVRHAWGFADKERRRPFTPRTLMPMCSNTKHFTCALVLDRLGGFEALDPLLPGRLPLLQGERPAARHLATNQSGLRDYWALTVPCGARPEGEFRPEDAQTIIGGIRTTHFAPGTQYSYNNGNFRLLAGMLEERTGREMGEMLRRHVWEPAGMETALYVCWTDRHPGEAVGYERNADGGYLPSESHVHWTGDAGLTACLDDMIAWERSIDRRRDDPDSPYRRVSAPQAFADGRPAAYGTGLVHSTVAGRAATSHGGALRGFRSHRLHIASERLSVVVMMNHEGAASTAAETLAAAVLGWEAPPAPELAADDGWLGAFLEPSSGLALQVERAADGSLLGRFGSPPERLAVVSDREARSASMVLRRRRDGHLEMEREADNLRGALAPLPWTEDPVPEGIFRSAELGATLTVADMGGTARGLRWSARSGADGAPAAARRRGLAAVLPPLHGRARSLGLDASGGGGGWGPAGAHCVGLLARPAARF